MRIQKYLSQQGLLSRRKAEEYLKKGWIKLNGEVVTELGTQINPETDTVELSEEIETIKQNYTYLAFNKPKGILTNCAQKGEKEIKDLLPQKLKHLSTIGRLDKDSEGLILLTDDGVYANSILNSGKIHERIYEVTTNKPLSDDDIAELEEGVVILDGYLTKPCRIERLGARKFEFIMTEGKNRQIRRMVEAKQTVVTKLKRLKFGHIKLDNLKPGDFREFKKH